jgi:hypothetical protein
MNYNRRSVRTHRRTGSHGTPSVTAAQQHFVPGECVALAECSAFAEFHEFSELTQTKELTKELT